MSKDAVSLIQAVVRDQLRAFKTAELGVVTGVYCHEQASDKNNYECDVRLRDSGLVLKRVPVATQRVGAVAMPNQDDLVLVQFLHGDIHAAIITGRCYNDQDRPPEAKSQEWVYLCPDDPESDIRRLYLEFPNGNTLLLEDAKLVIEMGKTTLTVNNDGDLEISTNGQLKIETKADAAVTVKGNLDLKASGDVNLEGTNVAIKGKTNATLEGTAATTVKGTTVKVAGKIDFSAV